MLQLLPNLKRLRLLLTFAGVLPCPPEKKNRIRTFLKENAANYISLERVISVDFRGKKHELPGFFKLRKRKLQIKMTAKMTMRYSIR